MQALMDRAVAHHGQGDLAGAEALYARILQADPAHLPARHMLGVIRAQQQRFDEAAALIGAVVAADASDAMAWANHGNVLNALGRHGEALDSLNKAVALHARHAEAWNNRGIALQRLGRLEEALESYDMALSVNPALVMARNNRGVVLQKLRRPAEALAAHDLALRHEPHSAIAHQGRGGALQAMGRYDEALAAFNAALGSNPDHAPAWTNRGLALRNLGQLDAARESFERAVALAPGLAEAQVNLGLFHLLTGDWNTGWPMLEARKRTADPLEARDYPQPLWTGAQDIKGKTLYAYIEQGLGDTIQFYRFAALVQARGARVVLGVHAPLIRLLQRATPHFELVSNTATPDFDYHIPLASIPLAVGLTPDAIPATVRYLSAEPERVAAWKAKLGDHGFRIAIAWQGNETIPGAEGKSFPVVALAEIARLPGVRLINVQKNEGAEQLGHLPEGMVVERHDFDTGRDAFLDTAAILEVCDLAIVCDTAIAHLAGALGVPAFVALKHVPDWRWGMTGDKSAWYPSLTLMRQPSPGDWTGLFSSLRQALALRLNKS